MNTNTPPNNQTIVFWTLWGAILSGMMVLQFVIGGGIPSGTDLSYPPQLFFIFCIGAIAIATIVRWIFIPRAKERGKLLVLMIIGLSLVDGAQMFQLFVIGSNYPQTQLTVLVLATLAALQYIPIYTKNIVDN